MSKLVVVGGVLAVSIAANAYLLATRGREAKPEPTAGSQGSSAVRAPTPAHVQPLVADDEGSASPTYAKLDRAQLEKRLATVEARLAKLLPAEERFELAERSPDNEARVKPFLDKVFAAKAGEKASYEVECHERLCKLSVDEKLAPDAWMEPLQSDPDGHGMFAGMSFGRNGAFLELQEPTHTAGWKAAIKLMEALRGNKALAECKSQNPTPGEVSFSIGIDSKSHRFVVEASGPLAKQALGVCARRVIDDAIAAIALPPNAVLAEPLPIRIQVP